MRTVQTAHSSTRPLLQRIGVLGAAGAVAVTGFGFGFGADAIGLGTAPVAAAEASGPQSPSWRKGERHVRGRGPRDTYG